MFSLTQVIVGSLSKMESTGVPLIAAVKYISLDLGRLPRFPGPLRGWKLKFLCSSVCAEEELIVPLHFLEPCISTMTTFAAGKQNLSSRWEAGR